MSVLALALLCCGGVGVVAAVRGSDKPKAASDSDSTAQGNRPLLVIPSASGSPADPTPAPTITSAPVVPAATSHKPTVKPRPTTKKPTTKPKPKPTKTTAPVRTGVHPGAFCSPRGAFGLTNAGTLMQCKPSPTDSRNRWRKA
jgi:hypothetical protein